MPSPLRVALVGYGLAGKIFHAPLVTATEGLRLTTVVSSDLGKVRADIPDVAVVGDLAAVLRDETIDLVVIATPDHLHAEQAIAALDAGKHVVVDKPFAPTLEQARKMADRAKQRGRTLSIFQNRRWDADFLTIKRVIKAGMLGEIVEFRSHFDRFRPDVGDRWKDKRSGGVWQDLGPHLVDQVLTLFGMPETLYADIGTQKRGARAPDYAHVLLGYGGLRVILHISQLAAANGLRFSVHGTGGSYVKHGLDPQEDQSKSAMLPLDPDWGIDTQPGVLTVANGNGTMIDTLVHNERGNYRAFYDQVRDAITGIGTNPVPPEQALDVMNILEAGLASARDSREVRF